MLQSRKLENTNRKVGKMGHEDIAREYYDVTDLLNKIIAADNDELEDFATFQLCILRKVLQSKMVILWEVN